MAKGVYIRRGRGVQKHIKTSKYMQKRAKIDSQIIFDQVCKLLSIVYCLYTYKFRCTKFIIGRRRPDFSDPKRVPNPNICPDLQLQL